MDADDKKRLIEAAMEARADARAHHSKFPVGAALLTAEGKILSGANVESDSYGLTCCAERVALFHAVTGGHKNFLAVAVVADAEMPTPCGACRQLLWEYAPDAIVLVANSARLGQIREFTVRELLPHPFVFKSTK
jgi:cytidine deaminase